MIALGAGAVSGLGRLESSALLQDAMTTDAIVLGQGLRVVSQTTSACAILLSDLLLDRGSLDRCVRVELGPGALAAITWDVRGQGLVGVGFTTSAQAESLASPVDGSLSETVSLVVAPLAHALVLRQGGGAILLIAGAQALGILDRLLDLAIASAGWDRDRGSGRGKGRSGSRRERGWRRGQLGEGRWVRHGGQGREKV